MYIRVVGGGSVGLLLAGKLTGADSVGVRVEIVCRTAVQAAEIARSGLSVISLEGERRIVKPEVSSFEDEAFAEKPKPDWILLALKQKDLDERVLKWLSRQVGTHTGVVGFQNGIGHEELLLSALPSTAIYLAVTTEGARRRSSVEVEHTGMGVTRIGRALRRGSAAMPPARRPYEEKLVQIMQQTGFDARWTDHIERYSWNKLVINSIVNPLTALLGIRNGALIHNAELVKLAQILLAEAGTVAESRGIQLDEDLWEQIMNVCVRTAANHSSMLQDVSAGRRTEIDWINGSLVRIAREEGIDAPTHRALYHLIKGMEAGE